MSQPIARARKDPQRRRRRPPRDGKDLTRRGAPLPDRAINRLGTVEGGTTVSDSDEDEHSRQLSISMSLEHTTWQDRKVNLVDVPGDPSFQGELRCAARVVEERSSCVSAVMGVEVGTSRAWRLADELDLPGVVS
jgi:elongation factor G